MMRTHSSFTTHWLSVALTGAAISVFRGPTLLGARPRQLSFAVRRLNQEVSLSFRG
jgi:hypothetical protein